MMLGLEDSKAARIGGRKTAGLQALFQLGLRTPRSFLLVPPINSKEISEVLSILGENSPIAVRSSMLEEDGIRMSSAGRFRSFVGLSGKMQVEEGVAAVISHARMHGVENACVLVQESIIATKSGILFSSDPFGRDVVIVESIYGLGELLAQGLVNPDRYLIPKSSNALPEIHVDALRSYGVFPVHVGCSPGEELELCGIRVRAVSCYGGKAICSIPYKERIKGTLATSELNELRAISKMIEEKIGEPQDIEWAKDTQGFVFLQTRKMIFSLGEGHRVVCEGDEKPDTRYRLFGNGASVGRVRGRIGHRGQNQILICDEFTPELLYSLKGVAGILAAKGGLLCHAAILAREFGIPCVVGLGAALDGLEEGLEVLMDGASGIVEIIREDER